MRDHCSKGLPFDGLVVDIAERLRWSCTSAPPGKSS
jgi:hypothetical protein